MTQQNTALSPVDVEQEPSHSDRTSGAVELEVDLDAELRIMLELDPSPEIHESSK